MSNHESKKKRQEMSTQHETPAGSLVNVPRFLNCKKNSSRSTEYDSILKVPCHVSHSTHCEIFPVT